MDSLILYLEINNLNYVFFVGERDEQNNLKIIYKSEVNLQGIENNRISDLEIIYSLLQKNIFIIEKKFNHTFKEIDRLFYDDGYINNNSFRGLRGQWYHSYGVDIALGYVYIAKLWGATIPQKIQNKLVNSAKVVNLAITDPKKFLERKNPDGLARNRITDPKKATPHTHQMAIAIDTLMEIVTGVKLEHDPIYLQKRKMHTPDGIDDLIGFNPNCI